MSNRTGRNADPRRTIALNSSAWQKLRATVLEGEPLCRQCTQYGLHTPATDVDHISGDPSDNTLDNLQPLCHECHSRKTARDHGKQVYGGCDVNGIPLDPEHPWNKQKSLGAERARPRPQPFFDANRETDNY